MKRIFSLTGIVLLGMLVIFLFCRVDCSDQKDDPTTPELCGPKVTKELNFNLLGKPYEAAKYFYAQGDGWAYYGFNPDKSYENVCAHEHLSGAFAVMVVKNYDHVKVSAEVVYGILYTYTINQWEEKYDPNYKESRSNYEFGIKNVYGDEPGWYFPTLTVAVEYQGDTNLTHLFFAESVYGVAISSTHYQWKDNSGMAD